jgi:hypothetical protein
LLHFGITVPLIAVAEPVGDAVTGVVLFEAGEMVFAVPEIKADDAACGELNTEDVNIAERVVPRAAMVRGSDGATVEAPEFSGKAVTAGPVSDPVGLVTDFADPGVNLVVELEYGSMRGPVGAVTGFADPGVNLAVELEYVATVE